MKIHITYKPGTKYGKHVLEVLYGASDVGRLPNSESVTIRKENIYRDIDNARRKVQTVRAVRDIDCIHLSERLLAADVATIQRILVNILNEFLPGNGVGVRVTVTHASSAHNAAVSQAVSMARELLSARLIGMMPANVATPARMAALVRKMCAKIPKCRVRVFDHSQLVQKKFGLILGVGESAAAKPAFAVVERPGSANGPRVAIVGKGVTFDSGGLAVKPYQHMVDMKFDKLGAVYGLAILMHLMSDPQWKHVTFYGAFPFVENAISATALRPGDVVRSYSGKTVEIANPDAEGRLILADAFAYLSKFEPDLLIDVATLTGHASMVNCWHTAYYFASTTALKRSTEAIGEKLGERMIPMPTWDDYSFILKSNVADLSNSPRTCGDAYVAALFLKEFVPKTSKWIHFDLAHSVNSTAIPSGNGIRTIIGVVENYLKGSR